MWRAAGVAKTPSQNLPQNPHRPCVSLFLLLLLKCLQSCVNIGNLSYNLKMSFT